MASGPVVGSMASLDGWTESLGSAQVRGRWVFCVKGGGGSINHVLELQKVRWIGTNDLVEFCT